MEQKTHIALWQTTRRTSHQRFRNHPGREGLFKQNGVLYSMGDIKSQKSMCSRVRKSLAILQCVKGDKAREGRQRPDLRKLKYSIFKISGKRKSLKHFKQANHIFRFGRRYSLQCPLKVDYLDSNHSSVFKLLTLGDLTLDFFSLFCKKG